MVKPLCRCPGIDGLRTDSAGNLLVAHRHLRNFHRVVLSPSGKLIREVQLPSERAKLNLSACGGLATSEVHVHHPAPDTVLSESLPQRSRRA